MILVFGVRVPGENLPLLQALRGHFGVGRIYGSPAGAAAVSGCYYRVNRPHELLRVVDHFDRYPLRGTKRKAFQLWREMVQLRAAYHRSRPPDRLERLAVRLSFLSKSPGKGEP